MTAAQSPFDPNDPFDITVEDLRQTLSLYMAGFIRNHATYQELEGHRQIEAIMMGGTVALMGILSAMVTPSTRDGLIKPMQDYIPDAFAVAQDIILNGEKIMAGGVQ